MGRHSAQAPEPDQHVPPPERARRRKRWPVAAFVAVLLIVGGWYGWSWLHSGDATPVDAAGAVSCPAGPETIQVAVTPSISDAISDAAVAYGRTNPVVTDHCVRVSVSSVDEPTALGALRKTWDTSTLGAKPDAWIADSSLWTNRLAAEAPKDIGDVAQSVASSPVVLAMPEDAVRAMQTASPPTYASLPALLSQPNGWSTYDEPGWGRFDVALPDPSSNSASTLAVEAMLDPATPQGQSPVTAGLLASSAVRQSMDDLTADQPTPQLSSTYQALLSLGAASGITHAPFSAVPVSEVTLYERNVGIDGGTTTGNVLDEVRLTGPTPSLDFPYLPLANYWVDTNAMAAAQQFRDFLLTKQVQVQLGMAGLRVPDGLLHPSPSPGMDWGNVAEGSAPTDATSYQRLTAAWAAASTSAR
jgi:Ca-activated chloride channel family protein